MGTRALGYVMIAVSFLLLVTILYLNNRKKEAPLVFSPYQMLSSLWREYKEQYLEPSSSRTIDIQRGNITTSEGQSYTMLRAVWMGDKETFDASWQWTKDNLQHSDDSLFAWLFGERDNGTYGIITEEGGNTTASDADTDIALALIFAYSRWQDPQYLSEARSILNDLWDKEVVMINGLPYLAANDIEKTQNKSAIIVNPSYLNPAAYRIFARIDPSHPWSELVESSYLVLTASITSPLDTTSSAGLPPDWIYVNKQTGAISAPPKNSSLTTQFGFDALRTPWHMALDWQWNGDKRAKNVLEHMTFLSDTWKKNGSLSSTYTHDGQIVHAQEAPAMYGGTIGYFAVVDPYSARQVYKRKLEFLYDPGSYTWKDPLSYYDSNWAWFGIALYNRLLPDLTLTDQTV